MFSSAFLLSRSKVTLEEAVKKKLVALYSKQVLSEGDALRLLLRSLRLGRLSSLRQTTC